MRAGIVISSKTGYNFSDRSECLQERLVYPVSDCYRVAAVRHFVDGCILHDQRRYDNAICHYAFSAECSIKAFQNQFAAYNHLNLQRHCHSVTRSWEELQAYHEMFGLLNANLYPIYGIGLPPSALFEDHPKRRYGQDRTYTVDEVDKCKEFAQTLIECLVNAELNGQSV